MRRLYPFVALALFASTALALQDFSNVEIKVEKVAGTVYMLTGAGGNIGVTVGEDGIVIIDDQYAPLAPKIEAALKTISDKPVRFILNTHYHGDHTGGNEHFGKGAPIVAHTNVRKRLISGLDTPQRKIPPAPKGALPVVTFDDSLVIHLNGEDVRAAHFPSGHTDGDAVIFFSQSNVVHMGDDFFNGMFPFVDTSSGGSVQGLIRNLDKILSTLPENTKIIPGHGPLADKAALARYTQMLKDTTAVVRAAINAGTTLEQMKKDNILAKWKDWAWQFVGTDRYLDTVYGELSKRK
jgi:cyclase